MSLRSRWVEWQQDRSRLARIEDGVAENRRLRGDLESRYEALAEAVVELAERRTGSGR